LFTESKACRAHLAFRDAAPLIISASLFWIVSVQDSSVRNRSLITDHSKQTTFATMKK